MDRERAETTLAEADRVQARMRARARWFAVTAVICGFGVLGGTLGIGWFHDDIGMRLLPQLVVLMSAGVAIGASGRVLPRRYRPMHLVMVVGGVALVHTVTVTVGLTVFPGRWEWWVPGAALAAVPAFVVALLALRWTRGEAR